MEHRTRGLRLLAGVMAATTLAGCIVAPLHPPRQREPMPSNPAPNAPVQAQASAPMYFYPTLQQDETRQDRDRYECYRWAVRQSNFDPGMTPVREVPNTRYRTPPPPPSGAGVAGGAVTGAVVGSVLAPGRRSAEGLVLGALFGAVLGANAETQNQRAYEQAQAREAARDAARSARSQVPYNNFRRAMAACMEGRGYNVQ